jgi:hypothetical protein
MTVDYVLHGHVCTRARWARNFTEPGAFNILEYLVVCAEENWIVQGLRTWLDGEREEAGGPDHVAGAANGESAHMPRMT